MLLKLPMTVFLGAFLFPACEAQSDDTIALIDKGVKACVAENYSQSANYFEEALTKQPDSIDAHRYLAMVYVAQWSKQYPPNSTSIGDAVLFDRALASLRKVVELDTSDGPRNRNIHYSLGYLQWAQAYVEFMRAVPGGEYTPPPRDANLRRNLQLKIGRLIDDAINHFILTINIDPGYYEAMHLLGRCLREKTYLTDNKMEIGKLEQQSANWLDEATTTQYSRHRKEAETRPCELVPPPTPTPPPPPEIPRHRPPE